MERKIFISSDHRGFEKKEEIKSSWTSVFGDLLRAPFPIDLGPKAYIPTDDFTESAKEVAKAVLENENSLGILLCGTGSGVCMAANRFKGIRAAVAWTPEIAKLAIEHNHANTLCLPSDFLSKEEIFLIIKSFLESTPNPDEKYLRRNISMDKMEEI